MDKLAFWKQKIVQAFHDPPAKPYLFYARQGKHAQLAKRCFKQFTDEDFKYYVSRPDRAATGADRPVLSSRRGTKGSLGTLAFHKDGNNVVTHPLAGGYVLRLTGTAGTEPTLGDVPALVEGQEAAAKALGPTAWNDAEALEAGFRVLWRRYRDELARCDSNARHPSVLWERMPADSRTPDHSIWEHLKVSSALAFMDRHVGKPVPAEKEPWLFTFSLSPVQAFIQESRTSRDLWVSSFLLADLAWHAMLPIVEHYGPDAIVYPELRGNPRVDNWLYRAHRDALPERVGYPATHAAVLPHTFVAILPRGEQGHLLSVEKVAKRCTDGLDKRWHELERKVRDWLVRVTGTRGWGEIWERQHQSVITPYWSAVHWQVPEQIPSPQDFERLTSGGALLAQTRELASEEAAVRSKAREARLSVWMPDDVWAHYGRARAVFGRVNLDYVQGERGFDYALTHHELRVRQQIRKQEARYAAELREPGEKCTVCRQREALWDNTPATDDSIDSRRGRVRDFWKRDSLSEDGTGAERLCGVCAFKRFLVKASGRDGGINPVWLDPDDPREANVDAHGDVRAPFPSTSAVAAQQYLAALAECTDHGVQGALNKVIEAHQNAGLRRTLFPRTLPRLLDASRTSSLAAAFLKLEPQESIFPEALEAQISRADKDPVRQRKLEQLQKAVHELRRVARRASQPELVEPDTQRKAKRDALVEPDAHIAVVMLDGDSMGRLLLGDARVMGAKWADVLHPWVVAKLGGKQALMDAGWGTLLDASRLMGPSLHAFISRALADFSHRIVPWVVEQEYGGRLIYAGGDDVLALAPARDALPMAARLQQLFSAAWIVDTRPDEPPWAWRHGKSSAPFDPNGARLRFAIPKALEKEAGPGTTQSKDPPRAIQLPVSGQDVELPIKREHISASELFDGQVLAGLGPHQSLSAGIVYGHFKTPLSTLLHDGKRLLEQVAKGKARRRAVALAHHSRGGLKSEIALSWSWPGAVADAHGENEQAHALIERVVGAFGTGALPSRLPYKLREAAPRLLVEGPGERRNQLAKGFLRQALDGAKPANDPRLESAVLTLWRKGFELHVDADDAPGTSQSIREQRATRSVDGFLLCRYLAGHGKEDE